MHLIDFDNNFAYIFRYAVILITVLAFSIIIKLYKFSKRADEEFI